MTRHALVFLALSLAAGCIESPGNSASPSADMGLDVATDATSAEDQGFEVDLDISDTSFRDTPVADTDSPDMGLRPLNFVVRGPRESDAFYRWTPLDFAVEREGQALQCELVLKTNPDISVISNSVIELLGSRTMLEGTCNGGVVTPLEIRAVGSGVEFEPVAWWVAHSGYSLSGMNNVNWESKVGSAALDLRSGFSAPELVEENPFSKLEFDNQTQLKAAATDFYVESSEIAFAWYGSWHSDASDELFSRCVGGDQRIGVSSTGGPNDFIIQLAHYTGEGTNQVIINWTVNALLQDEAAWVLSVRDDGSDNQFATLYRNGEVVGSSEKTIVDSPSMWRFSDIGGRGCNMPTPSHFGGLLYEVLVFDRPLSSDAAVDVSTYLTTKYGAE